MPRTIDEILNNPGRESVQALIIEHEAAGVPAESASAAGAPESAQAAARNAAYATFTQVCTPLSNNTQNVLIPQVSLVIYDRIVAGTDHFPAVVEYTGDQTELFLIGCITIARRMIRREFRRSHFLVDIGLTNFLDVLQMELHILNELRKIEAVPEPVVVNHPQPQPAGWKLNCLPKIFHFLMFGLWA